MVSTLKGFSAILCTLGFLVFPRTNVAQGYFFFNNIYPATGLDAPVFDAQGTPLSGGNYLAMLYVGADPGSLEPVTMFSNQMVAIEQFTIQGYVLGGPVVANNVGGLELVWVQMRAWDAQFGATFDEAVAMGMGGYGQSMLFQTQSGYRDTSIIPFPLTGLESFSLLPIIPEPGVWSLVLVAIPVLWLASRHRKR